MPVSSVALHCSAWSGSVAIGRTAAGCRCFQLSGRRARACTHYRARGAAHGLSGCIIPDSVCLPACCAPDATLVSSPLPAPVDCLRWILRAPAGRWSLCASTPRVRAPAYLPSMLAFARSLRVMFGRVKAGASTRRSQAPAPLHEGTTRAALRFHARRGGVSMYL